jgi:hypothetical protein
MLGTELVTSRMVWRCQKPARQLDNHCAKVCACKGHVPTHNGSLGPGYGQRLDQLQKHDNVTVSTDSNTKWKMRTRTCTECGLAWCILSCRNQRGLLCQDATLNTTTTQVAEPHHSGHVLDRYKAVSIAMNAPRQSLVTSIIRECRTQQQEHKVV